MEKIIKVLAIGILLLFLGCAHYVKYHSDVGVDELITAKTNIKVKINSLPGNINGRSIVTAIRNDLIKNLFPNVVETEPDLLVNIEIADCKITRSGLYYLGLGVVSIGLGIFIVGDVNKEPPAIFVGLGIESLGIAIPYSATGLADIYVRVSDRNGTLLKRYHKISESKKTIIFGRNENTVIDCALKYGMEKIKRDINRDRNEIVAAIKRKERLYEEPKEITKPSAITRPPKLTFNYSLIAENSDKILDGGEKISLKVTVKNLGEGIAQGVKVLLSGTSKALSYLGREKYLGDIPAGSKKSATFEAVLPYRIEPDEGNIIIKVTEIQGFGALEEKVLRVAMQPAKVERKEEIISTLIDVDLPLSPSSFRREDAYAVIIGITDYRSNKIPKVKYATRDAESVKEYLVNVCGIPKENIISLTDDKATLSDLTAYIEEWLARNVNKNSFVFIYFAGHGTPNPEKGDAYLVPYDGEPGFISKLYPLKRFYNSLEKLPTENIVVALDACFSGAGGRSVMEEGKRPLVPVKIPQAIKKAAIITASAANEISQDFDAKRHGLFTYYFLKGLRGEADSNGDHWITASRKSCRNLRSLAILRLFRCCLYH